MASVWQVAGEDHLAEHSKSPALGETIINDSCTFLYRWVWGGLFGEKHKGDQLVKRLVYGDPAAELSNPKGVLVILEMQTFEALHL